MNNINEMDRLQTARSKLRQTNRVYNRYITIEKQENVQDENGVFNKGWMPFIHVWANMQNLHGREYFTARQVNAQDTTKFIIRWMPGIEITEDMRIRFENKIYDINSIDNIRYQNEVIEIKAIEQGLKRGGNHE